MIFDNIKNSKTYYSLSPAFEKAFGFIEKTLSEGTEPGRYEIDGDKIFALVQSYDSKMLKDSKLEGHQRYIDIQYIISGTEMMGCLDASKAVVNEEYNAEKDVAFYEKSDEISYCKAGPGDFCIFFPHDIHAPGVACNDTPSPIQKIVVKVHI